MSLKLNGSTSGYVEIDAPAVAGSTLITLPATTGGQFVVTDGAGDLNVDNGTLFVDASTNRVGIGTASPNQKLEVDGNIRILNANNLQLANTGDVQFLNAAGTSYSTGIIGSSDNMILYTADTEQMRISTGGQVYVGQYANAYDNPGKFNVANGSRVTTSSGAYVPSNGGLVDYARHELISKCLTSFSGLNNKIVARNGAPLYITDSRSAWSHYTNLPNYLLGTVTHDCINNGSFTFTLACTTTVFLLRSSGWNPVDLSGWSLIESGGQIGVSAISDGRLYVKTLPAGTHALSNNSAMYFWLL